MNRVKNLSAKFTGFDRSIDLFTVFVCLLALEGVYQFGIRHTPLITLLSIAPLHALLYSVVLFAVVRLDLARLTIIYLALPYFIFIPGWLNTPTAILTLAIFSYCLFNTLKATTSEKSPAITGHDLLAFCLILVWVNLSGVGAYGHQSYDYTAHNARFNDLINYPWPVRYEQTNWGQGHNLVFYMGYFLPSAIIGKLTSFSVATQALHIFTLFSVTLALRWLSVLSQWRFSVLLVLIFILFGPQDLFGLGILYPLMGDISPLDYFHKVLGGDLVEFWASEGSNIFFGNFLSNTAQFFWSPPQVIAGWLMMALLTFLYFKQQLKQIVFVYCLLCLWAPLVMIALLPFIAAATLPALLKSTPARHWRTVVTFENLIGAGMLTLIFIFYYLSGSAVSNPSEWIWTDQIPLSFKLLMLSLFYLFTWGLYTLAISPAIKQADARYRFWFSILFFSMFALPLRSYGNYNDLMCRGSAPLMFLLLVFILRALSFYKADKQKLRWYIVIVLLVAGCGSALSQHYVALSEYGKTQPIRKVTDYRESHETLGPDGTFFEKYFRKTLD